MSYDYYDDWDSHYDYDSYDSDENVDVTISFNLKEAIASFVHDIMEYFRVRCQKINENNRGKRKQIAFIKDDKLNINSVMPWNVLWSNKKYDSCEEVDEEMISRLEQYFLNSEYDENNIENIRFNKEKANVDPVINYIIDLIMDGTIRVDCETDDLERIAREGIDEWDDFEKSRNAAADAYFHG